MIAWLASFPRSGNTLCRLVLEQVFGLPTMDEELLNESGCWTFSDVEWKQTSSARIGLQAPPRGALSDFESEPEWRLLKTHAESAPPDRPAIHIIRDGRDVLVSYAYFALQIVEGRPKDQISRSQFVEMLEGLLRYPRPRYGTWSSNVEFWLNRPHTVTVRYEDLVRQPLAAVGAALDQLGIPREPTGHSPPEFSALQPLFPEFFRSGRAGGWQTEFPAELLPLFWELNGATMERLGYRDKGVAAA